MKPASGPPRRGVLTVAALALTACFPEPPPPQDTLEEEITDSESHLDVDLEAEAPLDTASGETLAQDVAAEALPETSADTAFAETTPDTAPDIALDTVVAETNVEVSDAVADVDVTDAAADGEPADSAPEISDDTTVHETASEVLDTMNDTWPDNDTLPDVVPDADEEVAVDTQEPDVGFCPGGCAHLDATCLQGTCGEAGCEAVPVPGDCDDGLWCTVGDRCEAGSCIGEPVVCAAKDSCHIAGSCDPTTGRCSEPRKANGTPCDDADHCTEGEACGAGVCSGGTVPDDSGDWYASAPQVGNSELVFDEQGALWWFVSLEATTTSFGVDGDGQPVELTLPAGAAQGIGVVELDIGGRPVAAWLIAHSPTHVALLEPRLTHTRFVDFLGARQVLISASFSGNVELAESTGPGEILIASDPDGDHFVARLGADFKLVRVLHLTNPGAPTTPLVATGLGGELAIALNVRSDVLASIGDLATFRAPTGPSQATWVVYLSQMGTLVWQRALVGTDPDSLAAGQLLGVGTDGSLTLAGAWSGTVSWRRVDSPADLHTFPPFGTDELMRRFLSRVSTAGDLTILTEIGSTQFGSVGTQAIQLEIKPDGQRRALVLKVVSDLWRVSPAGGNEPLFADPPGNTFEMGVLEFDGAGVPLHAYVAASRNISTIAFWRGDLIVALSGAGALTEGGEVRIEDSDAPLFLGVPERSIGRWTIAPVLYSGATRPTAFGARMAWSDAHGIAFYGESFNGSVVVAGHPTWLATDRSPFLTYVNSEGGLVCNER